MYIKKKHIFFNDSNSSNIIIINSFLSVFLIFYLTDHEGNMQYRPAGIEAAGHNFHVHLPIRGESNLLHGSPAALHRVTVNHRSRKRFLFCFSYDFVTIEIIF